MALLIVGSSGFIGARVAAALEAAGHRVVRATRAQVDFSRSPDPARFREMLRGIEVVVNAAGIFREAPGRTFEAVHVEGPRALFAACAQAGVKVVQVSALGADAGAASAFHRSKRAADEALLSLDVPAIVLQPSLVFGSGGASARAFAALASLPWIPLPGDGRQRVQPVHVDDVAQAVARIVRTDHFPRARLAVVGPEPLTLRGYLAALRESLGLARARFLPMPRGHVARASRLRHGMLDADSLAMLERGNTADAAPFAALLGRAPRPASAFVPGEYRDAVRAQAHLDVARPLLRVALALVWLAAGIVSLGIYPVAESLALLERTGLTGTAALLALYGAAALDIALGVATLVVKRARWLWAAQAAVILGYTAIITLRLPEQWLHPYGPVVKNLPILAVLWLLHRTEAR